MINSVKRFHLEVTGKCNIACTYCYNSDFNNKTSIEHELTFAEKKELIEQAIKLGCTTYIFSGGEPFMNPEIIELVKLCPENSWVSILTNATKINDEIISQLSGIKQMRELKISLDGFQAHDKIRIGSRHAQIIVLIKTLKQKMPACKILINTMINKYSIKELLPLYELLKSLGIKHWRIDMPFNSGRFKGNASELMDISFEDIIQVYQKLMKAYFADDRPMRLEVFNVYKSHIKTDGYFQFDDSVHPCAYFNDTVTIRPNGELTFCPSLAFPIADWRQTRNLEQAIETSLTHNYNLITLAQLDRCMDCRYLKLCGGGCRADAITWKQDQLAFDPVSCSLMPLIEKYIIPVLPEAEQKMYLGLIDDTKNWPQGYKSVLDLQK